MQLQSSKFKVQTQTRYALAILLCAQSAIAAQQRDTPAAPPAGTGEISGVVVAAEGNGEPMRRAVVTLTGGAPTRSVLADDAGRFSFQRLPAGTYTVTARKAAYIAAPYGAKRPGRTGMPIALANAQRTDITIQMFRGAAITGVLRDAAGIPVRGVDIRAIDARTLMTLKDTSPPLLAATDDRGVYRIFGLLPGDYFIVALPMPAGQGEIVAPGSSAIDAALVSLSQSRTAGLGNVTSPPPVPPSPPRPIGFSPVYFPGTSNATQAVRVHVESGEERAGVDFEMRPASMAAIDGIVRGDVPNLAAVQVTLIPIGPRVAVGMSSNSLSGRPIDAQGTFRYANLPPGSYRLVARGRRGGPEAAGPIINVVGAAGGGRGGGTPAPSAPSAAPAATAEYLYGFADVELRGEDVSGVSLVLQPGGTISGRVVFSGTGAAPKPEDFTKLRASVSLEGATGMVNSNGLTMGNSLISNASATVDGDGTFEIRGIGPGRFTFNTAFNVAADAGAWKLRSAVGPGLNLIDDALDLGPGIDLRNVVVTFSDARTEISGTLQGVTGELTTEFYIVAMPADRALWRLGSRRIASTRPATNGRFVFADLPAGDYIIAALTDLDPIDLQDAVFLEQIAPSGAKVTIVEGEKKVQDLRIR